MTEPALQPSPRPTGGVDAANGSPPGTIAPAGVALPVGREGAASSDRGGSPGGNGDAQPLCTQAQLRRFIKSRPYVPLHELRRRFGLNGADDDVAPVDVDGKRLFVGPARPRERAAGRPHPPGRHRLRAPPRPGEPDDHRGLSDPARPAALTAPRSGAARPVAQPTDRRSHRRLYPSARCVHDRGTGTGRFARSPRRMRHGQQAHGRRGPQQADGRGRRVQAPASPRTTSRATPSRRRLPTTSTSGWTRKVFKTASPDDVEGHA